MSIRRARPDDLPDIVRIVRDAYTPYIARIGRPPGPMGDDYARHVADGTLDVATPSGRVVGLIVLLDRPDHLLLDNVVVDPAEQGRGVGRALMAHAEAVARARGFHEIRLYTNARMTENIATYARAGYVETGRGEQDGFARVFFAKPLG